jgi:hypothetical protein
MMCQWDVIMLVMLPCGAAQVNCFVLPLLALHMLLAIEAFYHLFREYWRRSFGSFGLGDVSLGSGSQVHRHNFMIVLHCNSANLFYFQVVRESYQKRTKKLL